MSDPSDIRIPSFNPSPKAYLCPTSMLQPPPSIANPGHTTPRAGRQANLASFRHHTVNIAPVNMATTHTQGSMPTTQVAGSMPNPSSTNLQGLQKPPQATPVSITPSTPSQPTAPVISAAVTNFQRSIKRDKAN